MAEWFCQYWRYVLGFIGACVVLFFALRAAVKASAEHRKSYKAEEEYITAESPERKICSADKRCG